MVGKENMLTQENIEEIILNIISKKTREIFDLEKSKLEESNQELKDLDCIWKKVEDFSDKHYQELSEIWPVDRSSSSFLGYNSHLGAVFHDIGRQYECIKFHIEYDKKEFDRNRGFACITYKEISEETGLNVNSVKKYLDILYQKGKIDKKRDIGGIFYKLKDNL